MPLKRKDEVCMIKDQGTNTSSVSVSRFIEFDLGIESYAIPLLSIKEVIPVPETTPLPNSPSYFIGIMNLRGQIISVVDLRNKLKIKAKEKNAEEVVLIVDIEGISIGLVVDSINKVLTVPLDQIVEVPEVKSQVNAQYIRGVFRGNEKLTIMLDIEGILSIKEIKKLNEKAA